MNASLPDCLKVLVSHPPCFLHVNFPNGCGGERGHYSVPTWPAHSHCSRLHPNWFLVVLPGAIHLSTLASLHTPLLYLQGSLSIFAFRFQHKYLSCWEPFLTIWSPPCWVSWFYYCSLRTRCFSFKALIQVSKCISISGDLMNTYLPVDGKLQKGRDLVFSKNFWLNKSLYYLIEFVKQCIELWPDYS